MLPRPPVRIVHLGLGNFFRAHQAWYTAHSPDASQWGIVAFTGRSTALAEALTAQDCRYTLITRAAGGDTAEVIGSVVQAFPGGRREEFLRYLADPAVAVVTLTITEAGYVQGGSDSAAGRLVEGLAARRAAGGGPLTVVSCDNLPENGSVTSRMVGEHAASVDPGLAGWISEHVSFVTTMVDRITPATTAADGAVARELTGYGDAAPVVTEPFSEWVLSGHFPAGRPSWEAAGARFVQDIAPFEQRKLWLLNGAHSLLAYAGSTLGHLTIAEAVADPRCLAWVSEWWDLACVHLTLPAGELDDYRTALLGRFGNARIRHLLSQIAADGSQKVPVRFVPVLRRERAAGRMPVGAVRPVAAWINHLRGAGVPVKDVAAERVQGLAAGPLEAAVTAVLGFLDDGLAADHALVAEVLRLCGVLSGVAAGVPLSRTAASMAVESIGWRYLLANLCTSVAVTSTQQGLSVAAAAVAAAAVDAGADADPGGAHLHVDLRPDRVEMSLQDRTTARVTALDVILARRITTAVESLGLRTSGATAAASTPPVQMLEMAIDAMDIAAIRPFWKAVMAYGDEPGLGGPEDAVVDPAGRLPAIWFQQMHEPRRQRNRVHFDITVAHDEAAARVAAALAAGGVLVDESSARSFWVLADVEGNEVCVCTWTDRDERDERERLAQGG